MFILSEIVHYCLFTEYAMNAEFTLPAQWGANNENIKLVAERVALIIHGKWATESPPEMNNHEVWNVCPRSNNWWLCPPQRSEGAWLLSARYASSENCALIGKVLQVFLK